MRAVYISPNQGDQTVAAPLGLGFIFDPSSTAHALIQGAGQTVTIPAPVTPSQVNTATAPIIAAEQAQQTAQQGFATNAATITTNVQTAQAQIQAFIAGNPGGATLNAAQTLVLAKMLNGLCKILLQQFADTTGT